MKKIAFIITIIGISSLLFLLNMHPKTINSPDDLSILIPNQKLLVQGNVIKETYSKNYKTLTLDNEIQLKCNIPCPNYLNKNISALTILEKYNNKNYLKVLKISSKEKP